MEQYKYRLCELGNNIIGIYVFNPYNQFVKKYKCNRLQVEKLLARITKKYGELIKIVL
jgi:hypothetical protein